MGKLRAVSLGLVVAATVWAASLRATPEPEAHDHPLSLRTPPTLDQAVKVGRGDFLFESVPGWCRLPKGRTPGPTHGRIAIDKKGNVYFGTEAPENSVMVYSPEGDYVRSFAPEYKGCHGMTLREENGEEFIYAAHGKRGGRQVVKFRLDGSVVLKIPGPPKEAARLYPKPTDYRPTDVAVAPNGDIYVAEGYGLSYIHQYDKSGKYIRTFGGRGKGPGKFNNSHGLELDPRYDPPRLLVSDRENRRIVHLTLEGKFIAVLQEGLRRPCSVHIRGDTVAIAELEGRVTILDRENKVVCHLGDNPDKGQWARKPIPPDRWKEGVFTAPHAVCWDRDGNLFVMDWNTHGRISKLRRIKAGGR